MRQTLTSSRGMVTAPHHLAASSACAVLREGGNAVEAMVAAAATLLARLVRHQHAVYREHIARILHALRA